MNKFLQDFYDLPELNMQYGAPMGRGTYFDDDYDGGDILGMRVFTDVGGYDPGGAYWGHNKLWKFEDGGGSVRHFFVAETFEEAREQFFALDAVRHCPNLGPVRQDEVASAMTGAVEALLMGTSGQDYETDEEYHAWNDGYGIDADLLEVTLSKIKRFLAAATLRPDIPFDRVGYLAVMTAMGHGVGFGDDPGVYDARYMEALVEQIWGRRVLETYVDEEVVHGI